MPLLNCEINLLTWSANFVISFNTAASRAAALVITDTKLYIPVVNLSTDDNAKLSQQLKSSFKRTIKCNKY